MPDPALSLSLSAIYEPIARELERVQGKIYEILASSNELTSDVIRYFYSSPGKFLRPALCLLGASFGKPAGEDAVKASAAIEMFHSATLIHDDIIDGSLLRRNLPTVPIKWGPQVSVLVGDYMQNQAIRAIHSLRNDRLNSLFVTTASLVCEGELLEVKENNNFDLKEAQYFTIIEKKTASLMAGSLEIGAILGGLRSEECSALKNYGSYFGIAFQITDDCLDFTGTDEAFGKQPGNDLESGVLTLPMIRLLELVPNHKKSEVFKIFKSPSSEKKMEYLLCLMEEYDAVNYARDRAREFTDKARLELSTFPESPSKRSLLGLLDYVLGRTR